MKRYELFYLTSGSIPDNQSDGLRNTVNKLITDNGGKVVAEESWGRKRLAYPVKGERQGSYFLADFDMETLKVQALSQKLKLQNEILRYLLMEKNILSARDVLMQQRALEQTKQTETAGAGRTEAPRPTTGRKVPAKIEASKVSLEELDKKLDEILDQDIIK